MSHYTQVIEKVCSVKHILWIGTADIKDLYIKAGLKDSEPFLKVLADLIKRGVEVRLIHAKEPGTNFRTDFDKYPVLAQRLERVLCPRVHFKLMIFDLETVYIGSANLTGAGMGMKGEHTRNFEAGIFNDLNFRNCIPVGMLRSVEKNDAPALLHPVKDASLYGMQF